MERIGLRMDLGIVLAKFAHQFMHWERRMANTVDDQTLFDNHQEKVRDNIKSFFEKRDHDGKRLYFTYFYLLCSYRYRLPPT
jgi:hypothetical protein